MGPQVPMFWWRKPVRNEDWDSLLRGLASSSETQWLEVGTLGQANSSNRPGPELQPLCKGIAQTQSILEGPHLELGTVLKVMENTVPLNWDMKSITP